MSKYTNIILSNHEQYLEVLRSLEEKTEYVEMDFIDPSVSRIRYELLQNSDGELDFSEYSGVNDEDRNNEVLNFAFENLEFIKKEYSDRWSGAFRYVFKADRIFFEFLRKFESFFFNEPYYDENGEVCFKVKGSSLGIDAFYFFDKRHEEVFKAINYTGEVEVRNDLDLDRNIIETIESRFLDLNLTSNEEYLEVLRALEVKTKYIEIVQATWIKEDDEVVNFALDNLQLLEKEKPSEWWGNTYAGDDTVKYRFKADKKYFEFLRKFESFYINEITNNSLKTRGTDFGFDDICFYDEDNNKLFYTTTHEGYGTASTKLDLDMGIIKEFGDCDIEDMHLTSNEQYLDVLRALEDRCEYIELVQVDGYGEDDLVVNFALENLTLIKEEEVEEWWNDSVVPNEKIMEIIERAKSLGKDEEYIKLFEDELRDKKAVKYRFKADKVFFEHLRKYESFFINEGIESFNHIYYDTVSTDFGSDDISFIDKDGKPLFWTITGEGRAFYVDDLDLDMYLFREFF